MVKKTKLRPRRLNKDKDGRYFYLINGKKKFINTKQIANQKEILKINIKNIIPVPAPRKRIRKPSEVKPITNQQIVSKLVPIAPVSSKISESRLFKGKETKTPEEEKKLEEEKKKVEEDKKKADDEKKKLVDEKKALEDEKKKLSDDIKRLDDEKRKTEDEKRLKEIQRERDILEEERKKLQEDAKMIENNVNELKTLMRELDKRANEIEKKEKSLQKREEGISLNERLQQLTSKSSPTLSETSSVSSERIPKPRKAGASPSLQRMYDERDSRKDKSPTEKIGEFIKTSEKEEGIDLTPAYVNPEEANEGDIGYEETARKKMNKSQFEASLN